ncbi:hypothetical protein A3J20_06945 [Candidatus Gottesmanbacteria bacterium RIFCSPLOWO2_02_FULL_42_29]|uniref:Yip1 domain-containing protein n=2 Tax=Candidatus Gottesmaniibacteriota TaxID=1752720 RepID=A0A1F6BJJ7_9BACT|nr:MAG: hypothetical protein UV09_C0012G0048 [Candidatus Gottesmanbacteria bacterium GW2011_GWA2_42_18]KKS73796.1 MAG: hypothetical protein UV46_C0062G0011 [Candidatus Gottesmanbacteria bacterium GW2011_GWC2_42_8]OGG09117.1 MAG: hypothetical protein A2781_02315 [Candidatus Gottesmanbacteria bacterium RIFCSPHIGHO2_01_FULL_42_27]OGG22273.1 MAG: hypothetical protein A3E72_03140 [Candidatus Gottesmanbacteria bacterium RIFCSPHIGHO2_12_FULL_43_26]OGG37094.1 MAG: hypothetical protein A2968_01455 [Cand
MNYLYGLVIFIRNTIGIIRNPYSTYRKIATSENSNLNQTFCLYLLVVAYFLLTSLIRIGLKNPYLLTVKFNLLTIGSASGFLLMIFLFYALGKLWQVPSFKLDRVIVLWTYSLWPTLLWFTVTALLYRLVPPPRTWTLSGGSLSIVFITYSLTLLFWKLILFYLTLRFALKLDLFKGIISVFLIVPPVAIYSLICYKMGIFRIPFI